MENRLANPAPLGLVAFALTTWLFSMVNSGWYDAKSMSVVLPMALVYGGAVLAIAGILSYFRGNTFATVAFLSYGAFYISLVSYLGVFGVAEPAAGAAGAAAGSVPAPAPISFVGWYLIVWCAFTFYMWIASFRHNMVLQVVFLAWWITLALLAVGDWGGWHGVYYAGGYAGLVTAAVAAYLSAAEMINGEWGRTVLPVWPRAQQPAETLVREDIFTEPELGLRLARDPARRLETEPERRTGTRG